MVLLITKLDYQYVSSFHLRMYLSFYVRHLNSMKFFLILRLMAKISLCLLKTSYSLIWCVIQNQTMHSRFLDKTSWCACYDFESYHNVRKVTFVIALVQSLHLRQQFAWKHLCSQAHFNMWWHMVICLLCHHRDNNSGKTLFIIFSK